MSRRIYIIVVFATWIGCAFPCLAQYEIPTDSLTSWWQAEGTAVDHVGDNDGELRNGVDFSPAAVGHGFRFDGLDDCIVADTTSGLDGGAEVTYAAWVRPASAPTSGQYRAIVGVGDMMQPAWTPLQCRLVYGSPFGGGSRFYMDCGINDSNNFVWRETSTSYPADGSWYFVAAVFDGGTIDLYVNGALDNGGNSSSPGSVVNQNAEDYVVIGAGLRQPDGLIGVPFDGLIDEVALWGRALAPEEIQNAMLTRPHNLLINPGLDGDLTGWHPSNSNDTTFEYSGADSSNDPASGSAETTISRTTNNGFQSIGFQCVVTDPDTAYLLDGEAFLPSGQIPSGALQIVATQFEETDCTGPWTRYNWTDSVTAFDTWQRFLPRAIYIHPDSGSVKVRLTVKSDGGSGSDTLLGLFDDVVFAEMPNHVFADDFGFGDTDAWSAVVD